MGFHTYFLFKKLIEFAYKNLFFINGDLNVYKYGYYFMLADILYNCVVSHIDGDHPTTTIPQSIKCYYFSSKIVIDSLSNIIVVKTLLDFHGYFNEWKGLVQLMSPHLKDNKDVFEDYDTTLLLMKGMMEHQHHKWFEYLFFLRYLKIFRFTRWISMV